MVAKSWCLVFCTVFISTMMLQGVAWPDDWPNWRGPRHDGISQETDWNPAQLREGPVFLWRKQIGIGFSSLAVADGRVYAMGNTGKGGDANEQDQTDVLWCLHARTGDEVWKHTYASPLQPKNYEGGPSATPTVEAGRVYTLSKHGHVLCLDAGTGAVIWQKHLGKDHGLEPPNWGFAGSPTIIGELIVLNAGSYGLALHKQDGRLAWRSEKGPAGYASAVPYEWQGKSCAAILGHRELSGVAASTGQVLWKHPWKTLHDENIPDPIMMGNRVFISTGLGTGAALLEMDGDKLRELWSHKELQTWMSSSVLWHDHVYGVDMKDGALKCLDVQTGTVKWTCGGLGVGSVMLAGDRLIALSDKGRLIIAEAAPARYNELASAQILDGKCWTTPVLADGRIYARNAAGDMVCIDVSGGGS
jgi:outer membrane protein assembly factor BamB